MIFMDKMARRLAIPITSVYRWRRYGRGPKGYAIVRHVKFRWSEVEAWLQQQREPELVTSVRSRRSA